MSLSQITLENMDFHNIFHSRIFLREKMSSFQVKIPSIKP